MKNLLILVLFYLMSLSPVLSQEKNSLDLIDKYLKELKLDSKKEKQFALILEKFTPQLSNKELSVRDYNALMKLETLEIYDILSTKQFALYKKLVKSIEPNKKYRIENNKY